MNEPSEDAIETDKRLDQLAKLVRAIKVDADLRANIRRMGDTVAQHREKHIDARLDRLEELLTAIATRVLR